MFIGARDEGGVIHGRYDFQQNRYNMDQVGVLSGFEGDTLSVCIRPSKQYDPVQRLYVVTDQSVWQGLALKEEGVLGGFF